MPNNKPPVLGVIRATKRKFKQDPAWEEIYESQLQALVKKGFAKEVTNEELEDWTACGKPVFYIAHQLVVQPESTSTPIRVVFNSSQNYQGFSLNGALELGPNILNCLHSVLLRFCGNTVAAQGDIGKMYYMARVNEADQMMQLFVW